MAAILQQRCSAQSILIIANDYTSRACHFTREDLSLQGISGTCSCKFPCLCGHCVSVPVTCFPYMLVLDVLVCVLQMILSRCSSLQQDPLCFSIFKCCPKFLCTDCYTKGLPQRTQHFKSKFCDTVAHNMLPRLGILLLYVVRCSDGATGWPNVCNMFCAAMWQCVALQCCMLLAGL